MADLYPTITITVVQQPTGLYNGTFAGSVTRNNQFILQVVNECEISSSWKNLTDTCKIKLPKNIIAVDSNGGQYDLYGNAISPSGYAGLPIVASGQSTAPIFMRGDMIKVEAGYVYVDNTKPSPVTNIQNTIFYGWVSKIVNKIPMEIECEDMMWKFKQFQVANKVYSGSAYTVQQIIEDMLSQFNAQVILPINIITDDGVVSPYVSLAELPNNISTNIGNFRTQNETLALVLERLRKDCFIESWFRNFTDLYSGGIVYYPGEAQTNYPVFNFQQNIIPGDHLQYTRADDINIGAKVFTVNKIKTTTLNKSGSVQTKNTRLQAFVGYQDGAYFSIPNADGPDAKHNFSEIRSIPVLNDNNFIQTVTQLIDYGEQRLRRFMYEGFRGKFETFGLPLVRHGDIIQIIDFILPERCGQYFVKGVTTKTGVNGFRQEIELDIRICQTDISGNVIPGEYNLTAEDIEAGI